MICSGRHAARDDISIVMTINKKDAAVTGARSVRVRNADREIGIAVAVDIADARYVETAGIICAAVFHLDRVIGIFQISHINRAVPSAFTKNSEDVRAATVGEGE